MLPENHGSSSESHEGHGHNSAIPTIIHNFKSVNEIFINETLKEDYLDMIDMLQEITDKEVEEVRKMTHRLHGFMGMKKSSHPECKRFNSMLDDAFKVYVKDIQCCVDNFLKTSGKSGSTRLCANALSGAAKILSDTQWADLQCQNSNVGKCNSRACCKLDVSDVPALDPIGLENVIGSWASNNVLFLEASKSRSAKCVISRSLLAKTELENIEVNFLKCIRAESGSSSSESH